MSTGTQDTAAHREYMCESVPMRRYEIQRLKTRLERARRQRNEWRAKFERLEYDMRRATSAWHEEERKRYERSSRQMIDSLRADVLNAQKKATMFAEMYMNHELSRAQSALSASVTQKTNVSGGGL